MTYLEEKTTSSISMATQFCLSSAFRLFGCSHSSFDSPPLTLMGLQVNYAGKTMNPFETIRALQILRLRSSSLKFHSYSPTGIRSVLINDAPRSSVLTLSNSTNIGKILFTTIL